MELNIDCLRNVLLYIEKSQDIRSNGQPERLVAKNIDFDDISIGGFKSDIVYYHVKQLCDSKLIKAEDTKEKSPKQYVILDITPSGHEFLTTIKSGTVFNKVKEKCLKLGVFTVSTVQQISIAVITELIKSQISL